MSDGSRKEWGGGCREGRRGAGSHLQSIFTGSELLNWELELERVSETLQIQLHLGWGWGWGVVETQFNQLKLYLNCIFYA